MKRKILIPLAILVVIIAAIAIYFTQKPKEPETIKIGAILPLTGDFSLFGGWLKEGIDFAVSSSNLPVRVIYEDNANQNAKSVSSFQKLVKVDKVNAVITARTPTANVLLPLINSHKVFTIFTFADLPRGDKKYILNYHFPIEDEITALTEFAFKKIGKKAAILTVNDDFGRLGADLFEVKFKQLGGVVIYKDMFSQVIADFKPIVGKLKNSNPDFVFVIAWEQNFLSLTKSMKEQNLSIPIVGPNVLSIYIPLVKKYLPLSYFTVSFYDAGKKNPHYEEFIELFKKRFGKEPNMVHAESYEATVIILNALKKTKNLSTYFDNFKQYEGIFGKIIIDQERQAHFPLAIVEVREGEKKGVVWEFIPNP
jgi:branched-chain amino acid transport system substrate-binding protein